MAGIVNEESGIGRSFEAISCLQRTHSGDSLAEWRSSEQLENGTPSTSPSYWESDDDEEGAKPSELYGKHTWKIEKFSQINKRELRSSVFEVGGYKWYILIYPQGCDVCNHLSLFLCVANHDKLLPGWSHFAQFTIAVANKDAKKSKYSDTLHRFWKKEHDWGWKKFMELSKVFDGFIEADTLVIKAQVQVIREKADRPFHCLDYQYRRELVRVYLTNVEQLCRRFVEEKRGKLTKLIEDKARWSSFCAFWLTMDEGVRRHMSREKTEMVLKFIVKHFFIEKEVTSTLVMDSLYSGLKALERQSGRERPLKFLDSEDLSSPVVHIEKDMFVLGDDILLLLERAAIEPLPPKEDKGPQNRTKDGGSSDDFSKDLVDRDERRLTDLGRRTVETFVLAHIFSNKIEVAYQEAVALKRQEELIREEEEAWLAEGIKAKRGSAGDKEKKPKKKQTKQQRKNSGRKGKEKCSEEASVRGLDRVSEDDVVKQPAEVVPPEKPDDVACSGDDRPGIDVIASVDESSSTCSTPTRVGGGTPKAVVAVPPKSQFTGGCRRNSNAPQGKVVIVRPAASTPLIKQQPNDAARKSSDRASFEANDNPFIPFMNGRKPHPLKVSLSLSSSSSPPPPPPPPQDETAIRKRTSSKGQVYTKRLVPLEETAPVKVVEASGACPSGPPPSKKSPPPPGLVDVETLKPAAPMRSPPSVSRPSSAPIPLHVPRLPVASLGRSVSVASRDAASMPHSYRNAIIGNAPPPPSADELGTSGRNTCSSHDEDFPHLDIINDLLDDGVEETAGYYGGRRLTLDSSPPFVNGRPPDAPSFVRPPHWDTFSPRNFDAYQRLPDYPNFVCGVNGYTIFRPSGGH